MSKAMTEITALLDEYIIKPSEREFYRSARGFLKHKKDGRTVATLFTSGKQYDSFTVDLYFEDKDLENTKTVLKAIDEQMTEYFKEFFVKSELYTQYEEIVEEYLDDFKDIKGNIRLITEGDEDNTIATEDDIEWIEQDIFEYLEMYYNDLGMLYFDELQQPILEAIGVAK